MIPHDICLLRDQLNELGAQLKHKNSDFFIRQGIEVNDKISCWILRRIAGAKLNHWNRLTNGLVIDRSGDIWSFPFMYMPHFGESGVDYTFRNSDLLEKIDGRLVCVCFPSNDYRIPLLHTDSGLECSPLDADTEDGRIMRSAKDYISKLKFIPHDATSTFMFEYVDDKSPSKYPKEKHGIHLIGARQKLTFWENCEDELDALATRLNVSRPERWSCADGWQAISTAAEKEGDDCVGFILRNRTSGIRIKMEREMILNRNKKKQITYKTLLRAWVADDLSIITVYPDAAEKLKELDSIIEAKVSMVLACMKYWKDFAQLPRRELMEKLKNSSVHSWAHRIVMRLVHEHPNAHHDIVYNEIKGSPIGILKKIMGLERVAAS